MTTILTKHKDKVHFASQEIVKKVKLKFNDVERKNIQQSFENVMTTI